MFSMNLLKIYLASCGPAEASGWCCIEKAFMDFTSMPSTVLSFRFMCVMSLYILNF